MEVIASGKNGGHQRPRIGYTCPYIPVEILSAAGLQPYCLLHGTYDLMQYGTEYARIDACPLVRANIAHILQHPDKYAALVGTTGCDMSRRLFDIIAEHLDIPVFLMHVPRTDNFQIYSDEIDWLIGTLERFSRTSITKTVASEIDQWEKTRDRFRVWDTMRYAIPQKCASSEFHAASCSYYQGKPVTRDPSIGDQPERPRVYLVGSELSYESGDLLKMIEQEVNIVGDSICGLSQFLSVEIKTSTISGIKQAYYDQPPCIYRRPNHGFYDHVTSQLHDRRCEGVIGFTLDYCDAYEFEMKRIESAFGLPLLRIRTDYATEKVSQLKTRIGAFGEILCSKK